MTPIRSAPGLAAIGFAALVPACFHPNHEHVACGPGDVCPGGMTCNRVSAPSAAGTGGTGSSIGGDGGAGGVGSTGSKPGSAGARIMTPISDTGGGGAGGGGVGIIKILSADPGTTSDLTKVSPPPS